MVSALINVQHTTNPLLSLAVEKTIYLHALKNALINTLFKANPVLSPSLKTYLFIHTNEGSHKCSVCDKFIRNSLS